MCIRQEIIKVMLPNKLRATAALLAFLESFNFFIAVIYRLDFLLFCQKSIF